MSWTGMAAAALCGTHAAPLAIHLSFSSWAYRSFIEKAQELRTGEPVQQDVSLFLGPVSEQSSRTGT